MGVLMRLFRFITVIMLAVLLFASIGSTFAQGCGGTIPDAAALIAAINSATSGDTITLESGCVYTLTAVDNYETFGDNGLPIINKTLTIEGNGATIERSSAGGTPEFRIFKIQATGDLTLNNLTVNNGDVSNYEGGAINNIEGALTITNSTFSGNNAEVGGAINNDQGTVTIATSTFTNNEAWDGGVMNSANGTVMITDSNVSSNIGRSASGFFLWNTTTTITGSTFYDNHAIDHAGIGFGVINNLGSTLTITNSTFYNNAADRVGSVLYHTAGTTTFINSTVAGNSAGDSGGGIAHVPDGSDPGSTVELQNTIVAGNTAPAGPDIFGPVLSLDYNLIQNTAGATITGTETNNIYGVDPQLGPLQGNGGPTWTMKPADGSPVIDAGGACAQPTDQRGVARPLGSACDIGAVETRTVAVACDVPSLISTINTAASGETLSLASGCVYELTAVDNATIDPTGLPVIDKVLTIEGNGATIERDSAGGTPIFRIFTIDTLGDLTLNNITIANGYSLVDGGAIWNGGGVLTVTNSTFTGNQADQGMGGVGGAIANLGGTTDITNSTFSNNSAAEAGVFWNTAGGTATISNSTFTNNWANVGGAVANSVISGSLTVTGSTFTENHASWYGGALTANEGTIRDSTFYNNTALMGGAISATDSGSGEVTILNSTISGNSALWEGGGIQEDPLVDITFNLGNTIVGGNTAPLGPDIYESSGTLINSLDYNLIGDPTGFTWTGTTTHNVTGVDPLVDTLADNGGLTQTMALRSGSPAIDAGSCSSGADQRGSARPLDFPQVANADAGCDIGAFELQTLAFMANPDFYITEYTTPLNVAAPGALANDFDPAGEILSAELDVGPNNAQSFSLNPDGSFSYTPEAGWYGTDTFTYTARNTTQWDTHQVTIQVGPDFNIACDDTATFIDAVRHANINGMADTINLATDCTYTFTTGVNTPQEYLFTPHHALPGITSPITINGNGATLARSSDGGTPEFIIFWIKTGDLTLDGLTLTNGTGAIRNDDGSVTLNDSTVTGNITHPSIECYDPGTLDIINSTVNGNATGWGGTVYLSGCAASITNSTITGNTTSENGGGIYMEQSGTATITHSTIYDNASTSNGGGIYVDSLTGGAVTLQGTIVSGNAASSGNDIHGDVASNDYNLITDTNGANITGTTTNNIYGQDPLLGPLQDNGGPTHTLAPAGTSPALENGGTCGLATDQRGMARPQGSFCDIGAVEGEYFCVDGTAGDDVLICGVSLPHPSNGNDNIDASTGNDDITVLAGVSVNNIEASWGNDTVTLYGIVTGSLNPGGDDDTVILKPGFGAGVDDYMTIYAGIGYDILNVDIPGLPQPTIDALAAANPSGDTVVINGITILWDGFEEILLEGRPPNCNGAVYDWSTLSAAITTANNNNQPDVIDLPTTGGCVFTLEDTLTIEADNGNSLTINGYGSTLNGNGTFRLFQIVPGADFTLDDVTLSNGYAPNIGHGGAFHNDGGTLTITNSTLDNHVAIGAGGAIYNNAGGVVSLTDSAINNCYSQGGGGIRNEPGATLTLTNTSMSGNYIDDTIGNGGAIDNAGTLTITGGTFANNSAGTTTGHGGFLNSSGTFSLSGVTVDNNDVGTDGGGIFAISDFTISDSTFSNNSADTNGGAIATQPTGNTGTITNSDFTFNTAVKGGGIYNDDGFELTLNNVIMSNNTALAGPDLEVGGAIFNGTGTLTINGGTYENNSSDFFAGFLASYGVTTITGTAINSNTSIQDAGAIYLYPGADLTIIDSTLDNNSTSFDSYNRGGAIYADGATVTINNSTLSNNLTNGVGGAMFTFDTVITVENGSILAGNSTRTDHDWGRGGAIWIDGPLGQLTITDSTIDSNTTGLDGGGIACTAGQATISNSIISNNTTGGYGGGVRARDCAMTITDTLIDNNSVTETIPNSSNRNGGGGLFVDLGAVDVSNSLFTSNSSALGGGGIFVEDGSITVTNSTFTGNSAQDGGAIANKDSTTLYGNTIVGNSAQNGGGLYAVTRNPIIRNNLIGDNNATISGPDLWGAFQSVGFNFVEDITDATFTWTHPADILGLAPALFPLADNGGPTQTMLPLPDSVVVDAGYCEEATDQRGVGFARVVDHWLVNPSGGNGCDIGAVELQTLPPICPDGTPLDDVLYCQIDPPVFSNPDSNVDGDIGNDTIIVQTGVTVNQVNADAGIDIITVDGAAVTTVNAGADGDTVTVQNGALVTTINGAAGNDTITGQTGTTVTTIDSGDDDDILIIGGTVTGNVMSGNHDDTVNVQSTADGGGDNILPLDGGAGTDTLNIDFAVDGAIMDLLAAADPANDSITVNGETYTWLNFEFIYVQGQDARMRTVTISERELFNQISLEIAAHPEFATEVVVVDCVPGELLFTVEADGVVGDVRVTIADENGFATFLYLDISTANPDDLPAFTEQVTGELPVLLMDALNALLGANDGLVSMTVVDAGINVVVLREVAP